MEVDYARAAPFSLPLRGEPQLSHPSRAGNFDPGKRIGCNQRNQLPPFRLVEQLIRLPAKERRLGDRSQLQFYAPLGQFSQVCFLPRIERCKQRQPKV